MSRHAQSWRDLQPAQPMQVGRGIIAAIIAGAVSWAVIAAFVVWVIELLVAA